GAWTGVHDQTNGPGAVLALAPVHPVQIEIWSQIIGGRNRSCLADDAGCNKVEICYDALLRVCSGAGNQRREVARSAGLQCGPDRCRKAPHPRRGLNKQRPCGVAEDVRNLVVSELELELAILPERGQVSLVLINWLLRLQSYIIVRPEEIIEGGIEISDEEPVAQIAIFLVFRSPQQGLERGST